MENERLEIIEKVVSALVNKVNELIERINVLENEMDEMKEGE